MLKARANHAQQQETLWEGPLHYSNGTPSPMVPQWYSLSSGAAGILCWQFAVHFSGVSKLLPFPSWSGNCHSQGGCPGAVVTCHSPERMWKMQRTFVGLTLSIWGIMRNIKFRISHIKLLRAAFFDLPCGVPDLHPNLKVSCLLVGAKLFDWSI